MRVSAANERESLAGCEIMFLVARRASSPIQSGSRFPALALHGLVGWDMSIHTQPIVLAPLPLWLHRRRGSDLRLGPGIFLLAR